MSYAECLKEVELYKASFLGTNQWTGDAAILARIKGIYDRSNNNDKEMVKKHIIECFLKPDNVKQIEGFYHGGVAGAIAVPVADAITYGTPTLVRGCALAALGFFGGSLAGFTIMAPSEESKRADLPYVKIMDHLNLDITSSPDVDEEVESAHLRHRRAGR